MVQQKVQYLSQKWWYTRAVYHYSIIESFARALLRWFKAVGLGVNIPLWVIAACCLQAQMNEVGLVGLSHIYFFFFFFFLDHKTSSLFLLPMKARCLASSHHPICWKSCRGCASDWLCSNAILLPLSLSLLKYHACCCTNKNVVLQPGNSLGARRLKRLKIIFILGSSAFPNRNGLVQKVLLFQRHRWFSSTINLSHQSQAGTL